MVDIFAEVVCDVSYLNNDYVALKCGGGRIANQVNKLLI